MAEQADRLYAVEDRQHSLDAGIKSLENQFNALHTDLENIRKSIEKHSVKISETEAQVSDTVKELEQVHNDINDVRETVNELSNIRRGVSDTVKELEQVHNDINDVRETVNELSNIRRGVSDTVKELEQVHNDINDVRETVNEISNIRCGVSDTVKELEQVHNDINDVRETVNELKDVQASWDVPRKLRELAKTSDDNTSRLESDLRDISDRIEEDIKSVDIKVQQTSDALGKFVTDNTQNIAAVGSAVADISDKLDKSIADARDDTGKILGGIGSSAEGVGTRIEQKFSQVAQAVSSCEKAQTVKLENIDKSIGGLSEKLISAKTELDSRIKSVADDAQSKIKLISEDMTAIKADGDKLSAELETVKEQDVKSNKTLLEKMSVDIKNRNVLIDKYIIGMWNLKGSDDEFHSFVKEQYFTNSSLSRRNKLIYLCMEYEKGNTEQVKVGLKSYFEKFGTAYISEYLPLAFVSQSVGITDELISKSAVIFEHFEENRKNNTFYNYLNGKKFAIVGNSPSILGKGKGKKIDSCEVVFRMNTFAMKDEYIKDTGSKTTAFVDNANSATIEHENHLNCDGYELIYIPYDFWHTAVCQFCAPEKFINSLYEMITEKKKTICAFEPKYSAELKERLGVISPSAGIIILWHIYKMMGRLDKNWVYGFTEEPSEDKIVKNDMKDPGDENRPAIVKANLDCFSERPAISSFFANTPIYTVGHNFNQELKLRNEMFNESQDKK